MSLKVVLVLLFLLEQCCCLKYCHNLPQGVSRMRNGVDITRLDLLPLDVNEDNGFRLPIIDFHCEEGKTRLINEKMYEIPDEVISMNSVPSNKLEVEVNIYKKSSELRKHMGIDGSVNSIGGFFSASVSYKKMLYTISNTSRNVEEVKAFVSTNRVNIYPAWGMQMSKAAQSAASNLFVGDEKSIAKGCQRFIQTFGTHYLQYGKFGGSIRLLLETEEDYFKKYREQSIKAQTKMTLFKLINFESKLNGKKVEVNEEFSRNTRKKLSIHGGKVSLNKVIDVASWQSSVYQNPWLFNGKVAPIYDFFTNTTIRKILKRSVEIYIDKAYLRELYSEMNGYKVPPSLQRTLQKYKTQDLHLSKQDQPPHGNVSTLAGVIDSYLNGPQWFKQTTQLCLKWSAALENEDYYECGGVSSPVLCAPPGKMTEYYMDNTRGHVFGCYLSWGIMTSGEVPDWFKDVKICYRWGGSGVSRGKCGSGETNRLFCAQTKVQMEENNIQAWKRKRSLTTAAFALQNLVLGMEYSLTFLTLWLYLKQLVPTDYPKQFYMCISIAYLISTTVFTPLVGAFVDRTRSVKNTFFVCNMLLIVGNIVYSLPFSPWLLLLGRLISGCGGALKSVICSELIRSYPSEEINQKLSIVTSLSSSGFILGPGLNFLFCDLDVWFGGWHLTVLNFPGVFLAILSLVMEVLTLIMVNDLSKEYDLKAEEEKRQQTLVNCVDYDSSSINDKETLLMEKPGQTKYAQFVIVRQLFGHVDVGQL